MRNKQQYRGHLAQQAAGWLLSSAARGFQSWEQRQLAAVMPQVLGYRLLQLGHWSLELDSLGASTMLHHWVIQQPGGSVHGHVQGDMANLPIASRSVDAVLLPHSLELVTSPHALLREVDRVLCPRGQVIVLGFNPLSLWQLGRYLPSRGGQRYPRQARLYTRGRVCDWLGLLDFEVDTVSYFGKLLPWLGDMSLYQDARRWLTPLGQAYMIFARKRVLPLTPARRRWGRLPELGPAVLPEARLQRLASRQNPK